MRALDPHHARRSVVEELHIPQSRELFCAILTLESLSTQTEVVDRKLQLVEWERYVERFLLEGDDHHDHLVALVATECERARCHRLNLG